MTLTVEIYFIESVILLCEIADLMRNKNSRRAHRIHANRIKDNITELLTDIDIKNELQVAKLQALYNKYQQQFSKIKSLDEKILAVIDEEGVEAEQLKCLEERDVFYEVLKKG